jgi:hypothetical protein
MEKVLIAIKCSDRLPKKGGMYKTDLLIDALFDKKDNKFYGLIGPPKNIGLPPAWVDPIKNHFVRNVASVNYSFTIMVYYKDLETTSCGIIEVYPEYWYEKISIKEFKNKFL